MIKFKKTGETVTVTDSSNINAQALVDKGVKAKLPLDELHNAILTRLNKLREKGLDEEVALQALFPSTILDFETLQIVVSTAGGNDALAGSESAGMIARSPWDKRQSCNIFWASRSRPKLSAKG